jgi:endonuclease III
MKNSKEHAQRLQKLYRGLRRAHPKVERMTYEDPAEALICGIINERMSESAAQKAIREIKSAFVDWNDLRVSRVEEIVEALGEDTAASRAAALALTSALRGVFDEYHRISLLALKKLGKRPARQGLEKLEGASRFVVNYCLLTSLQAHAIPLTDQMVEYLRRNGVIAPNADHQDIEGFLTRQIAAKNAYEFYALLRRASESRRAARRTKSKARKRNGQAARRRRR